MPQKSKIAPEIKIAAVEDYLSGKAGRRQTVRELGITDSTLRYWVGLYKSRGATGLCPTSTPKKYPVERKLAAIKDYLEDGVSIPAICEKYDITKPTIVRKWLAKYNNHEDFNQPNSGGAIYMAKGRKTSLEERIEIVSYCIANNKDYGKAIEQYGVSYQQIYVWVRKYEKDGPDGLVDHRGKSKDESSMSEVEKLRAQLKLKEAENLRLQMENELLKKLEALERGIDKD